MTQPFPLPRNHGGMRSSTEAVLGFIGKYRPDGGLLRQGRWTVHYFDYNWGINEAQ